MTRRSGARTRLGVVALALAVLVLAGCRVDTTVQVDVADDGSGTVTAGSQLTATTSPPL